MSGRRHGVRAALAALLGGSLLAAGVSWHFDVHEHRLYAAEFVSLATVHRAALQRELDRAVEMVDATGRLFDSSERVTRAEFRHFSQRYLKEGSYFHGMAWAPRVPAAARGEWEARAVAEGVADFRVREFDARGRPVPAAERAEYFPLFYVEPLGEHGQVAGFDLASEPIRQAALEKAIATGAVAASAPLLIPVAQGAGHGIGVFYPVFRPFPAPAARRTALVGVVVGVFQLRPLVAHVITGLNRGDVALALYQRDPGGQRRLIHYQAAADTPPERVLPPDPERAPAVWRGTLELPDQTWELVATPAPAFLREHPLGLVTWGALAAGLALSLFLAYHLYTRGRRQQALERANAELAASRQQIELAHREWLDAFDALPDPVFLHDAAGRLMRANRAYARQAGHPIEDILGQPYWQVFPRSAGPSAGCRLARTQEDKVEEEITGADGTRYDARYFAVRDAAGGYRYSIHLLKDITAQRRAEAALQESERRLRRVFDAVRDGILVADLATQRFVLANRAICDMTGYAEAQLLALGVGEIHPPEALAYVRDQFQRQARGEFTLATDIPVLRRDGTVFYADVNSVPVELEGRPCLLGAFRDITERRAMEQELHQAMARAQQYLDVANVMLLALDGAGRVVLINHKGCQVLGYEEGELVGRDWFECCIPPEQREAVAEIHRRHREGKIEAYHENLVLTRDGQRRLVAWHNSVVRDGAGAVIGTLSSGEDITEQRAMERTLAASEERLALAMRGTSDGLFDWDIAQGSVYYSPRWKAILGYGEDEIGSGFAEWQGRLHPDDLAQALARVEDHLAGKTAQFESEFRMRHKDGHWVWILARAHLVRDAQGQPLRLVGTHVDVTERRAAEERERQLSHALGERLKEMRCLFQVAGLAQQTALPLPELMQRVVEALPPAWQFPEITAARITFEDHAYQTEPFAESPWRLAAPITLASEVLGMVEVFCTEARPEAAEGPFLAEERTLLEAVAAQLGRIVALRRGEDVLRRINRVLHTLSSGNRALVHAGSEEALLQAICRLMTVDAGYRLAWIGEQGADGALRTLAHAGTAAEIPEQVGERCGGAAREALHRALAEARTQVLDEAGITCPVCCAPDSGDSAIALPLMDDGAAFGVLFLIAAEVTAFDRDEVALLEELAADLAYGIRARRAAAAHERTRASLGRAMLQTISAIAMTVEKRDPYTAGHMQRVAQLAIAIARRLGLEAERITGLEMGALIHDIGKIYIPAEILNRPGRLSKVEFDLIKTHPEVGYDIVKDVEFPWPVADMIHQHHERLDGTGYPQGLRGEAICLEARILAVADVVEAIASHRPYRPAMPLEKALAEIEQHRGALYDPDSVDACLSLFREQGFHWE